MRKAVTTQLVTTEVTTAQAVTERQAVEAATVVSLVREHRRDISGQRYLAEVLKGQLEETIGSCELLEELIVDFGERILTRLIEDLRRKLTDERDSSP